MILLLKKMFEEERNFSVWICDPFHHDKESGQFVARYIEHIYEIDPLECPKCKAQMLIVAFIQDGLAIANIIKSHGNHSAPQSKYLPKVN